MIFLIILGGIIGFIVCYLGVVIFSPVLSVPPQPLPRQKDNPAPVPDCRKNIEYKVKEETIRSWLYLPPKQSKPVPCVILCHGFGGTKDIALEHYAMEFVKQGLAAIALEYRHFGESDGTPRQFFSFKKQEEDIKATISYARGHKDIDPDKIFIWGTSAGGGYGIVMAGDDNRIAGVIAQCAGLDHQKDGNLVLKREGIGYFLKLIVHAQRDKGRMRFGLSPHTIPLVGRPGTMAMLVAPGAFEGYGSIVTESSLFKNEFCVRAMLMPHGSNPMEKAKTVTCPVLLCVCEKDTLVAPGSHERVAEILGDKGVVKLYPIGHFDIYKGEHFKRAVKDQIHFIQGILDKK